RPQRDRHVGVDGLDRHHIAGQEAPGRIAPEVLPNETIDQLRDPAGFRDRTGPRIHGASKTLVASLRSKSSQPWAASSSESRWLTIGEGSSRPSARSAIVRRQYAWVGHSPAKRTLRALAQ